LLKIELKKLINFIKKNTLLSIFSIIFFGIIVGVLYNYFDNFKLTNYQTLYNEIFYLLTFVYIPFIYLSMEHFFKSKSIIFLKNFAISNTKLVNHLFFLFFIKMLPLYILETVAILPFYGKNLNFFKATLLLVTIYHLLFIVLALFIYGYASIIMMNDDLKTLRNNISGGWSDEKLAPMLFAPAALLATINFINIILSKAIEKLFWSETISFLGFIAIVAIIMIIIFVKGKKYLTYYLKRVYATISEFHNLYIDGSYNIEKGFKEEKFLNKFFPKDNFLILKEFKILKRRFRLQSLLIYLTPILVYLLFTNLIETTSLKKTIILIFVYLILILPIIKLYYSPFEYKHKKTIFPIKTYRIIKAKIIASLLYSWPLILSLIIFGFIYKDFILLYLVLLFILQNLFTYYLPNKRVVEVITVTLLLLSTII